MHRPAAREPLLLSLLHPQGLTSAWPGHAATARLFHATSPHTRVFEGGRGHGQAGMGWSRPGRSRSASPVETTTTTETELMASERRNWTQISTEYHLADLASPRLASPHLVKHTGNRPPAGTSGSALCPLSSPRETRLARDHQACKYCPAKRLHQRRLYGIVCPFCHVRACAFLRVRLFLLRAPSRPKRQQWVSRRRGVEPFAKRSWTPVESAPDTPQRRAVLPRFSRRLHAPGWLMPLIHLT